MSNKRYSNIEDDNENKKQKLSSIEYFIYLIDKISYKNSYYYIEINYDEKVNRLYEEISHLIEQPINSFNITLNSIKIENDQNNKYDFHKLGF